MWEVDPETKSKVYVLLEPCQLPEELHIKPICTARTPPENPWKCNLRRLLCPFPAMGLPQVRHLYLPHMRRPTPRVRRTYLLRSLHPNGQL